jgi:hypothetical protein
MMVPLTDGHKLAEAEALVVEGKDPDEGVPDPTSTALMRLLPLGVNVPIEPDFK